MRALPPGKLIEPVPIPQPILKHAHASPAIEIGESRDVLVDEVLTPCLDLAEVLLRPKGFGEWLMLHGRASRYSSTSANRWIA